MIREKPDGPGQQRYSGGQWRKYPRKYDPTRKPKRRRRKRASAKASTGESKESSPPCVQPGEGS